MKRKGILALFVLLFIGAAFSFFFGLEKIPPKDYFAAVSLGKKSLLPPHIPGQVLVIIQDPEKNISSEQGTMNVNSIPYKEQEEKVESDVQTILESKFGSGLQIDTHILFDRRGANFTQERIDRLRKIRKSEGYQTNSVSGGSRLIFAQVKSASKTTEELMEIIKDDPDIAFSQPNYIYSLPHVNFLNTVPKSQINNAENPSMLWNIFSNESGAGINADKVWKMGYTGEGVTVAVIDTGVDITHPDLEANIWKNIREINCFDGIDNDANGYVDDCKGWDFGDDDDNPVGLNFHGTHVSGIIAAVKNDIGVVGVAPNAKIMPLKVFPDEGFAQTIDVVNAIEYAWRNNADIISTSLGREDNCSSIEAQAIAQAVNAGVVVFTSSGNGDPENDLYIPFSNAPAVCTGSFATGATDKAKQVADYSNYFNDMVDAIGPGGSISEPILSASLNGGYINSSGTSMATPHASGIAALLFSKNPLYTPQQVMDILCQGADDLGQEGIDSLSGCGFINAQNIFAATEGSAPHISLASWSPNPVQENSSNATLSFSVCDGDGNLFGGDVRVWKSGTNTSFIGTNIDWKNNSGSRDCQNPSRHGITINFKNLPAGKYCIDIEISDKSGNMSNKITDVCITKQKPEVQPPSVLSPEIQEISVGDVPKIITVTAENSIFSLNSGGTGITKVRCENGSVTCELSAPNAPGKAILTLSGSNGQFVSWAIITVKASPPLSSSKSNEFEIFVTTNKQSVLAGDTIIYTIEYKNIGKKKSAVRVINTYNPLRLEILEFPSQCTNSDSKLICTIGPMDLHNSGKISYSALVK